MIGLDLSELPDQHQTALRRGINALIDECFDDVALVLQDGDFADTRMLDYLPRKYLPRYTPLFAKQFLACILTVTWKLWAKEPYSLSCVAEELAFNAIIERSKDEISLRDEELDEGPLDELLNYALEDADFKKLFDPAEDGVEDSEVGEILGMGHLHFGDWFKPFIDRGPVHPYVEDMPPSN